MADPASSSDTNTSAEVVNDRHKREYWCFISYRHADNKEPGRQWATWLHQTLETYEVPADLVGTKNQRGDVIPERIFPVFRDEEELPADASLSTPIEAALKNSRFLVVLCSPNAVRSTFVADEILRFKQLGKQDRILAAILYGEPTLAANMERECFPKPLRHAIDENGQLTEALAEPIAADFRLHDGGQGWTTPAAYRASLKAGGVSDRAADELVEQYLKQQNLMLLKIVAGILGLPLGVLTARDKAYQIERQKQRAKVLRRWLAGISFLAVAALVAGVIAVKNSHEAQAQRDQVAAKSRELSDTLGVAYFREGSARLKDQRTAREGLAYLSRAVREHAHPTSARRLLTFLQQREVWITEDAGEAPPTPPAKEEDKVEVPAFVKPPTAQLTEQKQPGKFDRVVKGPNGLVAVSWCEDVEADEGSNHPGAGLHHFRVWDAKGKPLCDWIKADAEAMTWVGNISSMTFSPEGTWLAVTVERWREPEYLQVWDFRRGVQVGNTLAANGKNPNFQGAVFTLVSFTPEREDAEGRRRCALLTGSSRGDACWLGLTRPKGDEESYSQDVATVSHSAAIRAAVLLSGTPETLVTASDDAEVWFTSTFDSRDGAGVPVLKLDQPVESIRPDATNGAVLQVAGRLYHAMKVPVLSIAGKAEARTPVHADVEEERQVSVSRLHDRIEDTETIFEGTVDEKVVAAHAQDGPLGLSVEGVGGAVTAFLLQDGKTTMVADGRGSEIVIDPGKGAHKQTLRGLVADMRPAAGGSAVTALTRQFEYQVFDLATGAHLSKPLVESAFFTDESAASELGAAMLSPDRTVLLTHSLHHEPPNVDLTWTMLWDCASGEPLSDRIYFSDNGMGRPDPTREPYINDDTANVEGLILHRAKPAFYPVLSELGELLGGLQLDAAGELTPVKQSYARANELMMELVKMSR